MKKSFKILGIILCLLIPVTAVLVANAENITSALRCFKCGGSGSIEVKVDCPVCNGAKYDKWGDKCYRCDGRGYIYETKQCPECGGSGEQTKSVPFPEPEKRW